jgi:hypothetical protein
MATENSTKEGKFWESLSEEHKTEIIDIDIVTNDETNLIGEEEIKNLGCPDFILDIIKTR